MARACGEEQLVVQHAQRIAQQPALGTGAPAGQRIAVLSAGTVEVGAVRHIDAGIVIDVGGRIILRRRHFPRDFFVLCHRRIANVDLVRDESRSEVPANARHAADGIADAVGIKTADRCLAAFIHQLRRAVDPFLMRVLRAQTGIGRPAVGDVVLAAPHPKFVFDVAVGPLLREVAIVFRRLGHEVHRGNIDAGRAAVEGFLLIAEIQRGAEAVASVIQAGREQRGAAAIVRNAGFPFAMDQVHPRAELVAVAIATARIQRGANLGIRGVVHADFRLREFARVFWLKVDHPAHAGACRAVHQRVGPFEDLDAVNHLGIHHLARQHAGQTAKCHVVAVELQAADAVGLRAVAEPLNELHPRVVRDDIGNGFRLLIFHQLRGVADDVERHVHGVLLAQHPHAPAVRHLSVKKGRYQLVAAGFEIAGWCSLDNEGVLFLIVRREGGMCRRANGERQQRLVHDGVVHR